MAPLHQTNPELRTKEQQTPGRPVQKIEEIVIIAILQSVEDMPVARPRFSPAARSVEWRQFPTSDSRQRSIVRHLDDKGGDPHMRLDGRTETRVAHAWNVNFPRTPRRV